MIERPSGPWRSLVPRTPTRQLRVVVKARFPFLPFGLILDSIVQTNIQKFRWSRQLLPEKEWPAPASMVA